MQNFVISRIFRSIWQSRFGVRSDTALDFESFDGIKSVKQCAKFVQVCTVGRPRSGPITDPNFVKIG